VLYLVHVLTDMFDRHVAQHRAIQREPACQKQAEAIADMLTGLYQAIGREHLEDESPNKGPAKGEVIGFGDA
jgi:hypothetical protein